jgi:hypothetical protein
MSNKTKAKPVVKKGSPGKNGKPKAMNVTKDQTQSNTHKKLITDMRKHLVTIMTATIPEEKD